MSKYLAIHHFNARCDVCGGVAVFDDLIAAMKCISFSDYGAVAVVGAYVVRKPDGTLLTLTPEEFLEYESCQ